MGKDDAVALSAAGMALGYVAGDLDGAVALSDRALALNLNLAGAWYVSGWVKVWLGDAEAAIEREARAMRLSPYDPLTFNMQAATAFAHYISGRYAEALEWAEMAIQSQPSFIFSSIAAAASRAFVGDRVAVGKATERLRQLVPDLRISNLPDLFPILRSEDFDRWAEGLRKAGLPE